MSKSAWMKRCFFTVVLLGIVSLSATAAKAQVKYGSISGKFVFKGKIPPQEYLIKNGVRVDIKGNPIPNNVKICAAMDLKSEALDIDPKGKGIGNIFVYIYKTPDDIHPSLKAVPEEKLRFDQKACRFIPHAMFVRTGQTVLILSGDNCSHNTRTNPLRNNAENFIVAANNRKGVPLVHQNREILPIKIECNIHNWMRAYWLILDHPYAVVTISTGDAAKAKGAKKPEVGTFKIDKIPVGEYEFRVWHERTGYIKLGSKKGFTVTIKADQDVKMTFELPLKVFDED
ncbi:MAG: hypothetical protein IID45_02845 [Planctomycetes bacterium]|nr:hypothetical protein [Planctomycetota bacterium]